MEIGGWSDPDERGGVRVEGDGGGGGELQVAGGEPLALGLRPAPGVEEAVEGVAEDAERRRGGGREPRPGELLELQLQQGEAADEGGLEGRGGEHGLLQQRGGEHHQRAAVVADQRDVPGAVGHEGGLQGADGGVRLVAQIQVPQFVVNWLERNLTFNDLFIYLFIIFFLF